MNVPLKRALVTQANSLARSAQEMTLFEKRLLLIVISQIRRGDEDFMIQEVPIWEMQQQFNTNTNAIYEITRQTARKLVKREVEIEDDAGAWTIYNWVSRARFLPPNKSKSGLAAIEIQLNEELKPFLVQLKRNFNTIPLPQLLSIPSFNSVRLFEILFHDSHALNRTHLTYEVDDLRTRMGLSGKYPKFKDFRYVLDRAREDLARHTVLTFTYKGIKRGRRYEHVRFTVKSNPNFPGVITELADSKTIDVPPREEPQQLQAPASPERQELEQALKAAGFMQDPGKTIDTYGEDLVRATLKLAKRAEARAAKTNNPIHNLGGLIMHMLKEGTAQKASVADGDSWVFDAKAIQSAAQTILDAFGATRSQYARDTWSKLDKDTQDTIHDFMKLSLTSFHLRQLQQSNWQGLIYEGERQKTMEAHGYLTYPTELQDVRAFAVAQDLLGDYDNAQQDAILSYIQDIDGVS